VFHDQPSCVGKAEKSLNGRDVGTHFATGKTGSSTVRRSLAALLAEELELIAVPRNLRKPDGSANFALEHAGDARLSTWMEQRLRLATWVKPEQATLEDVETAFVRRLRPPLNLDEVGEPRDRLRQARRRLADVARAWQPTDTSAELPPNQDLGTDERTRWIDARQPICSNRDTMIPSGPRT